MNEQEKTEHRGRYGQQGYYALADLPQRGSLKDHTFGSGWWELDQIFKFYHGQLVVVTGMPGHGKSTFMLNVLAKMAKRTRGIRSFLYVPENEGYILEKLMRILWQRDQFSVFCGKPMLHSVLQYRKATTIRRKLCSGFSSRRALPSSVTKSRC